MNGDNAGSSTQQQDQMSAATGGGAQQQAQQAQQQIPPGYLSQEQVDAIVVDRLRRDREARLRDPAYRKQAIEAWRNDEQFRAEVIEALGIKAGGKPTGEELAEAQKQWEATHLEPLRQKLSAYESQVNRLLRKDLHGQILAAAAAVGVKKAFLTPPVPGSVPPIVHMLESVFGYDEQTDGWYVKAGEGFAYSASPTKERPYKSVEEFLREWAQKEEAKELLEPRARAGIGYQGADRRASGMTVEEFEKLNPADQARLYHENPALWRQMMDQVRQKNERALFGS